MDDLPPVDASLEPRELVAHVLEPERRRLDVEHPPFDFHGGVGVSGDEVRLAELFLADARGVHELLVSEVHQVVEHELVVAGRVDELAVAGPVRVGHLAHVGNRVGVGESGVADPHPRVAVSIDDREGGHERTRVDRLLRRHRHAPARGVVADAVIRALDLVFAHDLPHRQGREPMPARIGERHRTAVLGAIHRQRPPRDGAGERFAGDLVVPRGHVPGVARIVQDLVRRAGLHADSLVNYLCS